jgi:hypothetical protein
LHSNIVDSPDIPFWYVPAAIFLMLLALTFLFYPDIRAILRRGLREK